MNGWVILSVKRCLLSCWGAGGLLGASKYVNHLYLIGKIDRTRICKCVFQCNVKEAFLFSGFIVHKKYIRGL